jgi:hypothetical protein
MQKAISPPETPRATTRAKAEKTHKTAIAGTLFRVLPIPAVNLQFAKMSRLLYTSLMPPLSPGPFGELEVYFRISWLFAAIGFVLAVLLLVIYVSTRKVRKQEAKQLLMPGYYQLNR